MEPGEGRLHLDDELEALRNRWALGGAGAISLVAAPLIVVFGLAHPRPVLLAVGLVMFVGFGAGVMAIRRGRGRLGRLLIVGGFGFTVLGRATLMGGVDSLPFAVWFVVVLLAAIALGARVAWTLAIAGIGYGGLLFAAEQAGTLPLPSRESGLAVELILRCALFTVAALVGNLVTDRLETTLGRFVVSDNERRRLIERYELAGQGGQFGVWDLDLEAGVVWLGPGVQTLFGEEAAPRRMVAEEYRERIHPEDRARAAAAVQAHLEKQTTEYRAEYRVRGATGDWTWVRSRGRSLPSPDGRSPRLVGTLLDIAATKEMEAELKQRAFHDPLTGLPNRELFLDRVGQALSHARRAEVADFAVIFLDLDGFKLVNDSLGHAAGDALLVEFAERLSGSGRDPDTVARLGGDEFTLLLHGVSGLPAARAVARRVEEALQEPFRLADKDVQARASMGILMGSLEYEEPVDVLRDADLAMYSVKSKPQVSVGVFEPHLRSDVRGLLDLDTALRRAIEEKQFAPWYQPIVDLRSGAVLGVEALARWPQPDGTVRPPGEFIARAEQTGLIDDLDRQIIERAIRELAATDLVVSVNMSARQFQRRAVAEWLIATLERHDLPPTRLQIEVTETTLLADTTRARRTLSRLRNLGISIALDDFGTGYSSLTYLRRLDLHVLKIDTSFVQERGPAGPGPVCDAILSVADKLELRTCAEGIETEEQRQALIDLGCTVGQGWLFHRALPLDELLALLEDASSKAG